MKNNVSTITKPLSILSRVLQHKFFRTRTLAIVLAIASAISGIATYFAIVHSHAALGLEPHSLMGLLMTNLVLVLALMAVIARRIFTLIMGRRRGMVGSRLQARIVTMFSLVAIVPAILVAIFSAIFFNYGIQTWFDSRVNTAIDESVAVARGYLEEHKKIIQADIRAMADDLNREAYKIRKNPEIFDQVVNILASVRNLPDAIVFQERGGGQRRILGRSNLSFSMEFMLEDMTDNTIRRASNGELVILTSPNEDRVTALIKLDNFFDTYLLVGRYVDNTIINHIEETNNAASQYRQMKHSLSRMQINFTVVFVVVSLLLLLAAIWGGMIFAGDVVRPVSELVEATERVKAGDLTARVGEMPTDDEVATLAREFNRMIMQLERQRKELISAQRISAWSDVARRIAHEIKNPLTPIQLAAERLKRKYGEEVSDKVTYEKYINTITRHVGDIGKMVEEFASFARMPAPVFATQDIVALLSDAVFSRECGQNGAVKFETKLPEKPYMIACDASQIQQVFTNVLKNAEEAVMEAREKGVIRVTLEGEAGHCVIHVEDNGTGFPKDLLDHVTEPYITTKSKGTGLGLTIVRKIVEDHGGTIEFANQEEGACVTITFPKKIG